MRIRRIACLFVAALVVALVLAPVALAQDTVMQETTVGQLPPSGGLAILLPAAALLLGAGVLTYTVLRRV